MHTFDTHVLAEHARERVARMNHVICTRLRHGECFRRTQSANSRTSHRAPLVPLSPNCMFGMEKRRSDHRDHGFLYIQRVSHPALSLSPLRHAEGPLQFSADHCDIYGTLALSMCDSLDFASKYHALDIRSLASHSLLYRSWWSICICPHVFPLLFSRIDMFYTSGCVRLWGFQDTHEPACIRAVSYARRAVSQVVLLVASFRWKQRGLLHWHVSYRDREAGKMCLLEKHKISMSGNR